MQYKQIKNNLIKAMTANKPKTAPYDTEAIVVRVEGNTSWVHIPGGVDETPVAMTINASPGDMVRVRVSNGSAWLVGNDTAPPTDDAVAMAANHSAKAAQMSADNAYTFAETVHKIAKKTDQHFFVDINGAHVTVGENTPNQGNNLLMTNDGIKVRNGITDLASFAANGAIIGEEEKSHVEITPEETTFYNVDGETSVGVISNANLSTHERENRIFYYINETGSVLDDISETSNTTILDATPYRVGLGYPLVEVQTVVQGYVYGEGDTDGQYQDYFDETVSFTAAGSAVLSSFPATISYNSTAHSVTVVFGILSSIELNRPRVTVTAFYYDGKPSSKYSFGIGAKANGDYSFAEGYNTLANGAYSFAGGVGTIANGINQAVFGKYNAANTSDLFIIGNGGSASSRSNIFRVMSNGIINTSRGNLTAFRDVFGPPTSEFTIGNNANINNYANPGCYYCGSGTVAATQTNAPFNALSYQMLVFAYGGNQRIQIAWQNTETSYIRYRIRTSGGVWGSWYSLEKVQDAPTLSVNTTNFKDYSSGSSRYLQKSGRIVCIHAKLTTARQLTAGTVYNIGDLNPKPAYSVGIYAKSGTSQFQNVYTDTTYSLRINPTVTIASGAVLEINGTYCTSS